MYWAAGMAGAPAWNAWMGTLIPEEMRTAYFAPHCVNRCGHSNCVRPFSLASCTQRRTSDH
ncbi:MAG: hypothetical protein ACKO3P_22255, partial [Planctomycetaceae bacterium]